MSYISDTFQSSDRKFSEESHRNEKDHLSRISDPNL